MRHYFTTIFLYLLFFLKKKYGNKLKKPKKKFSTFQSQPFFLGFFGKFFWDFHFWTCPFLRFSKNFFKKTQKKQKK